MKMACSGGSLDVAGGVAVAPRDPINSNVPMMMRIRIRRMADMTRRRRRYSPDFSAGINWTAAQSDREARIAVAE
jgi:hypothetical protein